MTISRFFLLFFLIFSFLDTHCQTVNSILCGYYDAIGGKGRIDSVETAIFKTSEYTPYADFYATISVKRDFLFRVEGKHDSRPNSIYCFDGLKFSGTNKAAIDIVKKVNKKPEQFSIFNGIVFVPESDLKKEPNESIKGINCYVLSYSDLDWNISYKYYFNVDTNLLVAEERNNFSKQGDPILYENYQYVDGILFPLRVERIINGDIFITEYTEIILNPELPDDIFDCNPE